MSHSGPTANDVLAFRLDNQHLSQPRLADPAALVAHLGAVQAQDYPAARWALAQRLLDVSLADIEAALASGAILRTHVLRPTWHFVAPADIRWMLALTGPRIKTRMAATDRRLELTQEVVDNACRLFVRALEGGRHLTRAELAGVFEHERPQVQRMGHLLARAEIDGVICSGPRRDKQMTYALLDERVPPTPVLDRDEALAELARRYFTSHGPATVRDFTWWSGLTLAEARRGLAGCGERLARLSIDGREYWLAPSAPTALSDEVLLLSNFDEYTVAYADRELYAQPKTDPPSRDDVPFANVILVGGRVRGVWKRSLRKGAVEIGFKWFAPPSRRQCEAVRAAAERYAAFHGMSARVV